MGVPCPKVKEVGVFVTSNAVGAHMFMREHAASVSEERWTNFGVDVVQDDSPAPVPSPLGSIVRLSLSQCARVLCSYQYLGFCVFRILTQQRYQGLRATGLPLHCVS